MPRTDGARVIADLKRLAEFGRYKTGVHRPTYSPEDVGSRQWLADKFAEAGLDPVISSVIDELIISLTEKSKVTSIIVTHEMESAFRIGTRMAMLFKGKIIEDAPPDQFRVSPNPVVHQFVTGTTEGPITETPQHADSSK